MEKASVTVKSLGVTSGAYIYSMYEHSSQRFADMKSYVPSVNVNMKSYVPTLRYPPMGQLANRMRLGMGNMIVQFREFRGYCGSTDLAHTPSLIDIELDTNTGNAISRTYIIDQLDRQKQQKKHMRMLDEIRNKDNRNRLIGPINKTFIPNAKDARKDIDYTSDNWIASSPTGSLTHAPVFFRVNSNDNETVDIELTEASPFLSSSGRFVRDDSQPTTSAMSAYTDSLIMSPNKRPVYLQLSSLVEEKETVPMLSRSNSLSSEYHNSKLTSISNNGINKINQSFNNTKQQNSNLKFKDKDDDDDDDDDDNFVDVNNDDDDEGDTDNDNHNHNNDDDDDDDNEDDFKDVKSV
jgi:hypothetical protein